MQPSIKVISQKMCLVGDFGVGKTSLIRQFVDKQFSDKYLSTVGVKISRKLVSVYDDPQSSNNPEAGQEISEDCQQIQLVVWDIEGSTKFKGIATNYLQGSKGALIVGDVTRKSSLINLTNHIQLFQSVNPKSAIVVAMNKIDLLEDAERDYLFKFISAELHNIHVSIRITSAKTGEGVDEIFQSLASQMIKMK